MFESVEGSIEGIKDTEQKRLFTQKLFNRLMFIAFVQKKGWLEFNGSGDYFKALWRDYTVGSLILSDVEELCLAASEM